jgi:hypothetical protein
MGRVAALRGADRRGRRRHRGRIVFLKLAEQLLALRRLRDENSGRVEVPWRPTPLRKVTTSMPGIGVRTCARILTEVTASTSPASPSHAGIASAFGTMHEPPPKGLLRLQRGRRQSPQAGPYCARAPDLRRPLRPRVPRCFLLLGSRSWAGHMPVHSAHSQAGHWSPESSTFRF